MVHVAEVILLCAEVVFPVLAHEEEVFFAVASEMGKQVLEKALRVVFDCIKPEAVKVKLVVDPCAPAE